MLSLLADAGTPDLPSLGVWVQLVQAGGFGAIAWYLIVKHLPKIQEDFTRTLQAERESRILELRAERESRAQERADYIGRMATQEQHCAEERKEAWAELAREIRELKGKSNTP